MAKAEMELDIVKAQLNGLSKQAAAVENSRTNVNDDCEAESVVQQQQPQQPKQTVKQKRNRVKNVAGPKPKGTRPPPKQDSSDNEEQSAVSEDERENRKSNSKSTRKRKAAAATARKVYKENRDDDDEKQSDSDKQERDVEEQPKQKRKLFKGNSQENLSAGLDRKNMTIPIGSLINPEAFQKIRNNFSLPKQ